MKARLAIILALLVVTGSLQAAVQTFSVNYSEGNPIVSPAHTMTLSQFDDLGGTRELTKATLTFTAQQSATITFENGTDSSFEGAPALNTASVSLNGTGSISLSSALNISGISTHLFDVNGQESGLPTYNGSGEDYFSFGNIISDLYTGSVAKTADLTSFVGTGDVSYDMTSVGAWYITGAGDANMSVADYITAGTLKIDYEYDVVPEPATASMMGLVGLAVMWIRRRFAE